MKKKSQFGQRAKFAVLSCCLRKTGPTVFAINKKTNNTKILKFAMIHSESWEHVWYKFQTFMLNMTEVTVK